MSDFKKRLDQEQCDLEDKIVKLYDFLDSEKTKEINEVQLVLLKIQVAAMETYNQCLVARLERL